MRSMVVSLGSQGSRVLEDLTKDDLESVSEREFESFSL